MSVHTKEGHLREVGKFEVGFAADFTGLSESCRCEAQHCECRSQSLGQSACFGRNTCEPEAHGILRGSELNQDDYVSRDNSPSHSTLRTQLGELSTHFRNPEHASTARL